MNSLSNRILEILEKKGVTRTEFAENLNVTQPYISKIINKGSIPSDRLIEDICQKFNIDEKWLRTGIGKMEPEITKEELIAEFIGRVLRDKDDSFKKRYIAMLSKLDEDGWEALEKVANAMGQIKLD